MLSEGEYLKLQSTRAKARFRQTTRTLADEVLAPFAIRPFIRARPWWCLGGAAVGGFVSGLRLRRRHRKVEATRIGGRVHDLLALVNQRIQRVLKSALGAIVVATLRGGDPARSGPQTVARRAVPNGDAALPRATPSANAH